jgi:transcription-repair coupling factor (superfamily II helicase)
MTADAIKRLEAIDSLEDLGSGFVLATHDLEIRGAGELLGDTQSGQIQEIGFSLYTELLNRAVASLKSGSKADLLESLNAGVEINLHLPALLPDDYVPDVHLRLMLYKRIANARDREELRELQIELIDRFGLLPVPARHLLRIAAIKLDATRLGIEKIDASASGGYLQFGKQTGIDPAVLVQMVQTDSETYRLRGADRLQYRLEMPGDEDRFTVVEELLQRLSATPARQRAATA